MARDLTATDFAAVIFDMDGTLIDSTPAVLRSWSRWAEENGLPAERLQGFHGVPSAGWCGRCSRPSGSTPGSPGSTSSS